MRRCLIAAVAALVAGVVYAQPTGVVVGGWSDVGPFRGTVDQLGSVGCSEGTEKIFLVTDGLSDSDCALGGGAFGVFCVCLDGAWVAGAGGGDVSSVFGRTGDVVAVAGDYDAPEISYTATTGADWTDPDPADAGAALDDLAGRATTHEADASAHHAKTTDAAEITTGVLAHERGGLEANVSAFGGLVRVDAGATSAVGDLAGLNTAIGASVVDGPHFTPDADPGVDHGGYVAGHEIADEAVALAQRATLNFTGDGVACVDNAGATRTDCTIAGGGSGDVVGPASSTASTLILFDDTSGKSIGEAAGLTYSSDATYRTVLSDRRLKIGANSASNFTVITTDGTNWGLTVGSSSTSVYVGSTVEMLRVTSSGGAPHLKTTSTGHLMWGSGSSLSSTGDTGLKRAAAAVVKVTNGSTGTGSILYGAEIADPTVRTCADSGDANPGTLVASTSGSTYLPITNDDADGCSLSLSETGATDGQRLEVIVRATAGGTVDINDTAGLHLMAGNFSMGLGDAITFRYDATLSAWVEVSRSNN